MTEEQAERAHDAACNEPDALAPEAMREEFINIVARGFFTQPGDAARKKAASIVDAILAKQMQFYEAQAHPELTGDTQAIVMALTGLEGCMEAVIRQGAKFSDAMTPYELALWRQNALLLREKVQKILELMI